MLVLTIHGTLLNNAEKRINELPGVGETLACFHGLKVWLEPAHNTAETLVAIRQLLDAERCVDRRCSIELVLGDGEKRKEAEGSYFRSLSEKDWAALAEGFDDDAEAGELPVFNPNPPPAVLRFIDDNQTVEAPETQEPWVGVALEHFNGAAKSDLDKLTAPSGTSKAKWPFDDQASEEDVVELTITAIDGMTVEFNLRAGQNIEITVGDSTLVASR